MWVVLIFVLFGCSPVSPDISLPSSSHGELFHFEPYRYVDPMLADALARSGVPWEIFRRLIDSESNWNPKAVNYSNTDGSVDIGIAQVNSRWYPYFVQTYGPFDPWHPGEVLPVMVLYLGDLYTLTSCWELAVVSYKTGYSRARRAPERLKKLARYIVVGG